MNNPVNLVDPTGMAPEGAGDPDKQPQQSQKLLNIKIYGQDKSLYYEGKPFSFGNGGFRFYSEKGSQGDLSLLKGNSGEGELINADLIYAFANYIKGYGVGNTYKTVKQGAEFVGNIFEAFDKGQNIVEDINRNIDTYRTKSNNGNTSHQNELKEVKTKTYSIIYPGAYTNGYVRGKETVVNVPEGQENSVRNKAKLDSIYKANRLQNYINNFKKSE
jgi:hypothetical protein